MSGRLSVVGTPIGNLDDLTPRAAAALRDAALIACEDTRRTGTLAAHVGARGRLLAVHAHNEAGRADAAFAAPLTRSCPGARHAARELPPAP